jgi:hypothetical protein
LVRLLNNGRLGRPGGVLVLRKHGAILAQRRRRSGVSDDRRGVPKIRRRGHCAVLVVRRNVVRWRAVRSHVGLMVYRLADILMGVAGIVRVRSTSAPTTARPGAHIRHPALHRLPSRQMTTTVHHAGLGNGVGMR